MKTRIISIVLLISLCLSVLASCSKKTNNDFNADINAGIFPNGNGGATRDKTMLTAAQDIANEVDTIPKLAEMVLPDSDKLVIQEAAYIYSEDNIENQISSVYDKFKQVDETVDYLKSVKNDCLSVCHSFDTWVIHISAGVKIDFKLNYDVTNNVVTVEQRNYYIDTQQYSYSKITVTYSGDGKLLIDYYTAEFDVNEIKRMEQIHYLEDNYFCHITKRSDEFTERMNFYDLKNKVWAEMLMGYTAKFDENGVYSVEYADPIVSYHYFKDGYYVNNGGDFGELYYEDGRLLGQWSTTFGSDYSLNLNLFSGWSGIDQYDDKVALSSSAGEILCPAYDNLSTDDFKYRVTWFEGWSWPNFSIRSLAEEVWSADEVKSNFIAASGLFGISGAEDAINFIAEQSFEFDNYHNDFHYMNGFYGPDLNSESFYLLVDMMSYETFTHEDLLAIFDTPAITRDSQVESFEYFEFLEFALEGKASVSDDGKAIVLDNFKASCEPSLLLKDNESYSLVFVFASPTLSVELGRASATYTGSTLVIESDVTVSAEAYPTGYGKYILKVYLADSNSTRISETYIVSTEITEGETVTADLSSEAVGSELTATGDSVRLYNYIIPSENETEIEIENEALAKVETEIEK